jgi:hypothetical protein
MGFIKTTAMNYLAANERGISEGFYFNFAPRGREYDPEIPRLRSGSVRLIIPVHDRSLNLKTY